MKAETLRARFFAPPAELAGCFTSFYLLEVAVADGRRVVDWLHPEWGNLRFFQGPPPISRIGNGPFLQDTCFTATGPSSCPTWFSLPTTRMWGVGLLPLGWAKFMGVPATKLADSISDGLARPEFAQFRPLFHALDAARGATEEEQADIVCSFFLARNRPLRDGGRIATVHAALVDPDVHSAAELAERSNLAIRTLERLCGRYFGFPPQLLIRRQRMMRTLATFMLQEKSTWSQAIDMHYTDHAHFTREFQAFMHMSPSDYAALDHPVLSAFMAERARVLGSPVQTLDIPDEPARADARA